MKIPEGWPTEEMIAAGFEVIHQAAPNERAFRIALFRAMLAAAPTPPAQEPLLITAISTPEKFWRKEGGQVVFSACKDSDEFAKRTAPVQEDEPVAEIKIINGIPKVVAIVGYDELIPGNLLYTRTADDKLRKADLPDTEGE